MHRGSQGRKKTSNGVEILRRRYVKGDPLKENIIQDELVKLNIAKQIYDLRQSTGLTQAKLVTLAGTSPSIISRLEDATYDGHSLTMLKRIAAALGKTIEVEIVDRATGAQSA